MAITNAQMILNIYFFVCFVTAKLKKPVLCFGGNTFSVLYFTANALPTLYLFVIARFQLTSLLILSVTPITAHADIHVCFYVV